MQLQIVRYTFFYFVFLLELLLVPLVCVFRVSILVRLRGNIDRLCGLVVRVSGYRYRGPGFDPRRYQIF